MPVGEDLCSKSTVHQHRPLFRPNSCCADAPPPPPPQSCASYICAVPQSMVVHPSSPRVAQAVPQSCASYAQSAYSPVVVTLNYNVDPSVGGLTVRHFQWPDDPGLPRLGLGLPTLPASRCSMPWSGSPMNGSRSPNKVYLDVP